MVGGLSEAATEKEASDYIGLDWATFRSWVENGRPRGIDTSDGDGPEAGRPFAAAVVGL
jgi:hypothetical protein